MKNRGRLIISVSGRITMFLYLFQLLVLALYFIGNFQYFTDNSLINLLQLLINSTLVFIAFAVSYIIILVVAGRNTGRRIRIRIAFTIAAVLMTSASYIVAQIIFTGLEPV